MMLAYVCRSIQTMGMLIKAGLPLAEALVLTRDMMPNVYYWRFFDQLRTAHRRRQNPHRRLRKHHPLPPMVTQMIVRRRTDRHAGPGLPRGRRPSTRKNSERIKVMTTALEPMIIVLLGGFVGFIAVSVILPDVQAQFRRTRSRIQSLHHHNRA